MESVTVEQALDFFMLFSLLVTALGVIYAQSLITSTVLLSVFSLLMAAEYLVLGAADVAITEAAVGAGISSILFLMALFLIGDKEKPRTNKKRLIIPVIVVLFVTIALVYSTFDMPSFGNIYSPAQLYVAPYYLEQAPITTGIPNVVTSILASYRGFDTFGETFVVLTAAIAVMLLLGRFSSAKEGDK